MIEGEGAHTNVITYRLYSENSPISSQWSHWARTDIGTSAAFAVSLSISMFLVLIGTGTGPGKGTGAGNGTVFVIVITVCVVGFS